MTDHVWHRYYSPEVPREINSDTFQSLPEMFLWACEQFKTQKAFTNFGENLTFSEMENKTKLFAAYLQQLGLKKGDRLAIMLPNVLQYPVALYGALRAGLIVVNINPLYTAPELIHQLTDTGTTAIIVLSNFASTLERALPHTSVKHVIVTDIADLLSPIKGFLMNIVVKYIKRMVPAWNIPKAIKFKDTLKIGKDYALQAIEVTKDDIAFLQPTSGTTGVPKSAMLTHGNMLANVEQMSVWITPFLGQNEVLVTPLPLYHIFSLCVNALTFFKLGGENILVTNPRDIPGLIKLLAHTRFTAMTGVNTLFNALLNHEKFYQLDFSQLRFVVSGGMAVQKAVAERWEKATGCHICEGYGLTESSPVLTVNPLHLTDFNGSIGVPVPSTDVKIIGDQGQEVPVGEIGELCAWGPQVMKGYWNKPEETDIVLDKERWLRTGDIAKRDQKGFFYLVDRKKNMIIVSGFNVYPNEIEGVIATMPEVREVGVIGIADENTGEAIKAFIVKKDERLTAQAVIDYCHQRLTRYKAPKHIEFCKELPKNNVGKILHRALREKNAA